MKLYTLTREALVTKYTGHPGVDISRIEPVDFIWVGGMLNNACRRNGMAASTPSSPLT
jgi:hypothetical protein